MSKHILVVDDDALLRRSLAFNLEQAGYRVVNLDYASRKLAIEAIADSALDPVVKDLEAKGLPAGKTVGIMNEECEKRNVQVVACPPELKKV